MDTGAIVGIVIGAIAVVLLIAFLVYWYWWRPHHNRSSVHREDDIEMSRPMSYRLNMDSYGNPDEPDMGGGVPWANETVDESAFRAAENAGGTDGGSDYGDGAATPETGEETAVTLGNVEPPATIDYGAPEDENNETMAI